MKRIYLAAFTGALAISTVAVAIDVASAEPRGGAYRGGVNRVGVGRVGVNRVGVDRVGVNRVGIGYGRAGIGYGRGLIWPCRIGVSWWMERLLSPRIGPCSRRGARHGSGLLWRQ